MTWSRFDDLYDEHEKVQDAWEIDRATIGLHVMATTACNRWLSDGVVRPRWLTRTLPDKRERERVLAAMVKVELFDVLSAGEQRQAADSDGHEIVLGPFDEERYIVHDFLDRHESSVQIKERREREAERKRRTRRQESEGRPAGSPAGRREDADEDSDGSPSSRADAPASRPDPTPSTDPPNPPQAGGTWPEPPLGNRKTDRARYQRDAEAWAAEHFPGVPFGAVASIAGELRSQRRAATADAIREYAALRPRYAHYFEQATAA